MKMEELSEMELKQVVGVAGSALIFMGVFSPVEQLGIAGNSSLIGRHDLASILTMFLAALSFILALLKKCRYLWGPGTGLLIVLMTTLILVIQQNKYGLGSLQWGWLILLLGAVAVMASAVLEEIALRK